MDLADGDKSGEVSVFGALLNPETTQSPKGRRSLAFGLVKFMDNSLGYWTTMLRPFTVQYLFCEAVSPKEVLAVVVGVTFGEYF